MFKKNKFNKSDNEIEHNGYKNDWLADKFYKNTWLSPEEYEKKTGRKGLNIKNVHKAMEYYK